ncbi:unnamed protein product [Microthlaspi erraticum]|uniref:Uncharacterized protein n=1 Tax=Microthlaspi erraticum TaxID=1685480 RepID=A0A6D2JD20_9BRAS|nr:unnamed protein product [Microthlaspi erraticum]
MPIHCSFLHSTEQRLLTHRVIDADNVYGDTETLPARGNTPRVPLESVRPLATWFPPEPPAGVFSSSPAIAKNSERSNVIMRFEDLLL